MKSISSPNDHDDWLHHHVPYRIRAGLAGLSFASEFLPATADDALRARFAEACLQNAACEGRMAAIRWLIDFIGIHDKQGKPARPHRWGDHDVSITSLPGGSEIDLDSNEAETLRRVWKGCSQASSHATHDLSISRLMRRRWKRRYASSSVIWTRQSTRPAKRR
jgi:hypothetical protein